MRKFFVVIFVLIAILVFSGCSAQNAAEGGDNEQNIDYSCEIAVKEGEQKIAVLWNRNADIKRVDVKVSHGDMTVSDITVRGETLRNGYVEADAFYGRHSVSVTLVGNDGKIEQVDKEVSLFCDEYVIAPISGSMPQLYFTLYMDEITDNYKIPAFVWLTRPGSWNWDKLPENVYPMPTADVREVLLHNNYSRMVEVTDAYIEELYSVNPDSKFKLYINDYNMYLYPKLMEGNRIPKENYEVVLLSDGGASYAEFNRAFNSEDENFDANEKYEEMAEKLDTLLEEVRDVGDYNWIREFTIDTDEIRQYAYVAAREMENVEWWVLRPRIDQTLFSPDKEFLSGVLKDITSNPSGLENPVIVERGFTAPLSEMSDKEKDALKEFYNFGDEMFSAAVAKGKKVMMFLGSWADELNEPDFESYVKLMKKYYGDEFVYYYKGHPSTPTSNYPEKAVELEALSLIDVESSINSELILFFYPDIYMCGYNSSTFMSVERDEMACAIFNMKKEDCPVDYKEKVGFFSSRIQDISLYPECNDESHKYFLIEYNREKSEYEYSIYDATEDVIINANNST